MTSLTCKHPIQMCCMQQVQSPSHGTQLEINFCLCNKTKEDKEVFPGYIPSRHEEVHGCIYSFSALEFDKKN